MFYMLKWERYHTINNSFPFTLQLLFVDVIFKIIKWLCININISLKIIRGVVVFKSVDNGNDRNGTTDR